jgi:hypothetical protein
VSVALVPSSGVFVALGASCVTGPTGSQGCPWPSLADPSAIAAVNATAGTPTSVLVGAGTYTLANGAVGLTLSSGINAVGGCNPSTWACDGSAGATTVKPAASGTATTIKFTGDRFSPIGTLRGFTVFPPDGTGLAASAKVTAVECAGCMQNVDMLTVPSVLAQANVVQGVGLYVHDVFSSTSAIQFTHMTIAPPQTASWGACVYLTSIGTNGRADNTNIVVADSVFTTPIVVPLISSYYGVNVDAPQVNAFVLRNRFVLDGPGNSGINGLAGVYTGGSTGLPAVIGNTFWMKASNMSFGMTALRTGYIPPFFVNNTVIGTNAAKSGNTCSPRSVGVDTAMGPGASLVANNVFDNIDLAFIGTTWNVTAYENAGMRLTYSGYTGPGRGPGGTNLCSLCCDSLTFPSGATNNPALDCQLAGLLSGDAHLTSSSPCVDVGYQDTLDPALDLDGTARPQGAAIDLGAYELKL